MNAQSNLPLLELQGLCVHFPVRRGALFPKTTGTLRAVDGVTFSVRHGGTLGLVGESGCGKSTIGRAILGIQSVSAGRILFDGVDITYRSKSQARALTRRMQMIFQDSYSSLDPRMRIDAAIGEPLRIHEIGNGQERRERVSELLETVGLPDRYAELYPHELSGGQRQRIGIARALALNPEFLVCDEAVSALDVSIQAQIINLLVNLQKSLGLTYLFIAHDIAVVRQISDQIVVMYLGKVMETGQADMITQNPLHPYTRLLMAAVPIPHVEADAARRDRLPAVVGEVPSPLHPPRGCRFSSRCPEAQRLLDAKGIDCSTVEPSPVEVADGHVVACHLYSPTSAAV